MGTWLGVRIILLATDGQSLAADATFFIPNSNNGEQWNHPNFLGYDTFLSRIRIAIDGRENTLYFGSDLLTPFCGFTPSASTVLQASPPSVCGSIAVAHAPHR
jgi:hypothetical protein